ncbi:MAG: radical SAM family heme chaperone HemW [Prevotella sp.]|nr:radical SAM family heme chaperone HemW [Prevotella sp.]MDY4218238.1 radical SAM family heme chaperone HemW [Prevotella sp.]
MAALYIHVPFCASRCIYCGFYSTLTPTKRELRNKILDRYVSALCGEIRMRKDYFERMLLPDTPRIETIYLGGGTPSQLSFEHLNCIFSEIQHTFGLTVSDLRAMEITIECNPDDITEAFAADLERLPINRVSMGVQTFSDDRLRFLRRRHTASHIDMAVTHLRNSGIKNISIDLMFGFPNETLPEWKTDIEKALSLNIEHISAYSLMYEESTPLYALLEKGKVRDMEEETYRQMYDLLIDTLNYAGYEQYEISNFAKLDREKGNEQSPFRSQHNAAYWQNKPYLGLGASAHSYNLSHRHWNIADLMNYMRGIEEQKLCCETEEIDEQTHYNDLITTALRMKEGLSINELSPHFKSYVLRMAAPYLESNRLVLHNGRLSLTREGIYVSDAIMAELMYV